MNKEKIEQKAFDYFNNGFNCAEAMLKTLNDNFGLKEDETITKFATAFGGGIGGTKEESCGALNGAIVFLGSKYGREISGRDIGNVMDLAAEFREKFVNIYSCTKCSKLLEHFGPQENSMECKKMVGNLAGIFADILTKEVY